MRAADEGYNGPREAPPSGRSAGLRLHRLGVYGSEWLHTCSELYISMCVRFDHVCMTSKFELTALHTALILEHHLLREASVAQQAAQRPLPLLLFAVGRLDALDPTRPVVDEAVGASVRLAVLAYRFARK